jgi:hypothetical protein
MANRKIRPDIYEKYHRILQMRGLSRKSINEMRKNLALIAQIICEHVWGKKFY